MTSQMADLQNCAILHHIGPFSGKMDKTEMVAGRFGCLFCRSELLQTSPQCSALPKVKKYAKMIPFLCFLELFKPSSAREAFLLGCTQTKCATEGNCMFFFQSFVTRPVWFCRSIFLPQQLPITSFGNQTQRPKRTPQLDTKQ